MVIRSFQDKDTEAFFKNGRIPSRKGWASVRDILKRKIDMLHYAIQVTDYH